MIDVPAGHLYLGEALDPATRERTGEPVLLEAADLTTHGVIVGMTGSGKTGLGVVLFEEALLAGRPDPDPRPQGRPRQPAAHVPRPAPRRVRPVGRGRRRRRRWRPQWREGLAAWGIEPARIAALRDAAEFTIYTPGSTSGVPLNVVGSLRRPADGTDAETVADEVEGFVSGLLGWSASTPTRCRAASTSCSSNLVHDAWDAGVDLDLAGARRPGPGPAAAQARGATTSTRSSRRRTAPTLAMTLNGLLASPAFAAWAAGPRPRHRPAAAVGRRRPARLRHRHPRPPRRRGAAVRRVAAARQARHVDAPPARHRRACGCSCTSTRCWASCPRRRHRRPRRRS